MYKLLGTFVQCDSVVFEADATSECDLENPNRFPSDPNHPADAALLGTGVAGVGAGLGVLASSRES
jgi:hypothetical protein